MIGDGACAVGRDRTMVCSDALRVGPPASVIAESTVSLPVTGNAPGAFTSPST